MLLDTQTCPRSHKTLFRSVWWTLICVIRRWWNSWWKCRPSCLFPCSSSALPGRSLTIQFRVVVGVQASEVFKVFSQNRTQQHFSPISKKNAEVARSPSARVHAHSSSSTPAAYVEPMESSEWVQLSDDATSRTYFWNRRTRLSSWHQGRLGRNSGMRRGSSTTGTRLLTRVSVYDLPPLPPSWWASE